MVMCVVSNDVYSSNGKVLLIERGSKAFGERREVMLQGQARIAALWSRIDTPNGVFVDVNSLATDSMGAAGIPAQVDNHLGERFGGAILLSLISDLGQAAANRASDSRGTIQFGTTATAGEDLASKTLENTINIPPTGYVTQGSATTILVLRDMDFRSVYELARK
jgi:type IV secretion system protein VirB10